MRLRGGWVSAYPQHNQYLARQRPLTSKDHLRKQTALLASKPAVNGRIPAKRLEKYGHLEADILK